MLRIRIAMVAAGMLAATAGATPAHADGCSGARLVPTRDNAPQIRHATLCLLNAQRRAHGLHKLRSNGHLRHAASGYAHLMSKRNFFSHVSPAGSTPLSRIRSTRYLAGARSWAIAENLAWGVGSMATPRGAVRAWMRSPGHRRNILDPSYREIGIGVAHGAPVRVRGASAAATYATDFGARR
jgi:uncharacterized protein YkwD